MNKYKEKVLGVILAFTQVIVYAIIGLILTPFLLKGFGVSEFGLYELIGSLAGYFAVMDFGLASTVTRYIAKNENDKNANSKFYFLIVSIFTIITILIVIIGIIMYYNLDVIFSDSLNVNEISIAEKLFLVLLLNTIILIFGKVFYGVQSGYELFVFQKLSSIIKNILNLIFGILLVYLGYKSIPYTILILILNIILLISNALYTTYKTKLLPKFHFIDIREFIDVIKFSFYNFIQAIVGQMYWKIGAFIVGFLLGASFVPQFSISIQLNTLFLSIVTAIGILLLPKATGLVVKKQNYYDFFIQYGRLILVTYTFAIVLFIGIGKELIFYWVGTDFVETYYITLIILLSSIGWRFQTPLFEMSRALKKHGKIAIINLFGATLNVLLAFVFVSRIGTIGTAFAIAIPVLIFNTLISTLIYKRMFKLDLHKYFQDIFNGIFPAFILSIIISILLSLLSYGSLFIQLTIYIVYLIAIIIVYYNLGVSTKEKLIIKNFLIEVVNHFRKKVR